MPNLWLPNGSSYITAPTLGDITSSKIRVVGYVNWSSRTGYWFSQAGSGNREIGLFVAPGGNDLQFWQGGTVEDVGALTTLFGSTTIQGILDFTFDFATGDYTIELNSSSIASGTVAAVGTNRVAGCLFRIGARANDDTSGSTTGAFIVGSADEFGDVDVYIDDVLQRSYAMPASGTTVTDSENSQDGTLQAGTGGGADWQEITGSLSADALADPIYAIDESGNCGWAFTGTYTTITPSAIQYRVMQGATQIIAWANVDSFGSGVFSVVAAIPVGAGYTVEFRDDTILYSDVTESFNVGPVVAFVGSSSASRLFDNSSDTTSGVVHVKSGTWSTTDTASMTGEAAVALANYLYSKFSCPVGLYDYGVSGSQLLTDWDPGTGSDYSAFASAAANGNLSCIVDITGYNDANAGNTVTQADIEAYHAALRSDTKDVPIIILAAQRDNNGTIYDTEFVELWQASKATAAADADTYIVYRHDLEIGDGTHQTQAGESTYCERIGAVVDYIFGDGSYYKGPEVVSFEWDSDDTVTVTLSTTGTDYTTLSPSTAIAGFIVNDNGTPATISSAVKSGESTIVLTTSATMSGPVTVEFAGFDANATDGSTFANYPTVNSEIVMPVDPLFAPIDDSAEPPDPPGGDITVNNPQSSTSATLASYSIGAGTAGRRKLVVHLEIEDFGSTTLTSIAFGVQALTEEDHSIAGDNEGWVFFLDDAGIGAGAQSANIVATFSGSPDSVILSAVWLNEIAQGAATQTVTNQNTNASETAIAATLTGVADGAIIINGGGQGDPETMTQDGTQTLAIGTNAGSAHGAIAYEIVAAGNHTQGWTGAGMRRPNMILVEYGPFSSGSVELVVPDISVAASIDNIDLVQANALAVNDLSVATSLENIVLSVSVDLVVADMLSASDFENVDLSQAYTLSVNDVAVASALDNVVLAQAYSLTVPDVAVSAAFENIDLVQAHTLSANDLAVASSIDNVVLSTSVNLSVNDILVAALLDNVELVQAGALVVDDIAVLSALENVALTQANIIDVPDIAVASSLDAVVLSTAIALSVADILSATSWENVVLSQAHILGVPDISAGVSLEGPTLQTVAVLNPADMSVASSMEGVTLDLSTLLEVQDMLSALAMESPEITQAHVLVVPDIDVATAFDGIALGGGVFYSNNIVVVQSSKKIMVVEAIDRIVKITKGN